MGDRNEKFRDKLGEVLEDIRLRIEHCLEEAQQQGEVPSGLDVTETSDFILSSFQGAVLQMKVFRTTSHQRVFDRMIFEELLKS